jgi:hypothetical protein
MPAHQRPDSPKLTANVRRLACQEAKHRVRIDLWRQSLNPQPQAAVRRESCDAQCDVLRGDRPIRFNTMPMQTEITLAEVAEHLEVIEIGCRKCDLYDRLSVAELIEEYGADQALPGLLGTFTANCPRHRARPIYARCGAYWELMRRDPAPRIVLPIIILAALAAALLLFGLAALQFG